MMTDERKSGCTCVVDTSGLHEIATASSNLKPALLARLADGRIAVPTWAWQEFSDVYPEEAQEISDQISKRLRFNAKIEARAAQLTEINASGLSIGAYDDHVELYTASAAYTNGYTALTSPTNLSAYKNLHCEVRDLISWIEEQS
jgi:hypothetical protein